MTQTEMHFVKNAIEKIKAAERVMLEELGRVPGMSIFNLIRLLSQKNIAAGQLIADIAWVSADLSDAHELLNFDVKKLSEDSSDTHMACFLDNLCYLIKAREALEALDDSGCGFYEAQVALVKR
jgi:hypothetical protein